MKQNILLNQGWELKKILPAGQLDAAEYENDGCDWLTIDKMPAQVQDVLLSHGLLPEEMLTGWCRETLWIADYDWVYRCRFKAPDFNKLAQPFKGGRKGARLFFEGLDTFADVYLNGKLIIKHENFYLPDEAEVNGILKEDNLLLIHFHRITDYLDRLEMDPKWDGAVMKCKQIRKPIHDFPLENPEWGSNYQGAVPYFTPVGVYRNIYLHVYEEGEIRESDITVDVNVFYDGFVKVNLKGTGADEDTYLEYEITEETSRCGEGESALPKIVASGSFRPETGEGKWQVKETVKVKQPRLWWPHTFGEPFLYRLKIFLYQAGRAVDRVEKSIGFRRVEMPSPLEFILNGKRVRLWGGSMDPLQGYTHCWVQERGERLFDMAENANMNILRIWGEGIPLPEEFYDLADRRGILIWQEFFMGHGAYPDTDYIREECKKEAETLIKRLRHRPSLLMWCGGNETIMGAEFAGKYPFGSDILLKVFPELVKALDPDRYYHPNSPYGGEWANDPRIGDYHTYDCVWQYPYQDYPNFITEHIRTSPPVLHSLKRIIKGDVWNETYDSGYQYGDKYIMPENWVERSHLNANGQRKTGAYWEYYDAGNAEDMIYRFGAAYGKEIRRYGEQIRRGSKNKTEGKKRSKGYFSCKLLDTWPKVYCATIDFFQEGYIPYYTIARLFAPVMLSFQKEESIRLWIVNDSPEDLEGSVTLGLYHLGLEEFIKKDELTVGIGQGEADMIFDLAEYRFFPKDCVLYAVLKDKEGKVLYTAIDYVDVERHLKFKEAEIKVSLEDNELVITSDAFVRCVEIKGTCGEDEFGWLFSDNYFDLMPGEIKRVRVLGNKDYGTLSVKGHYLKKTEKVAFVR